MASRTASAVLTRLVIAAIAGSVIPGSAFGQVESLTKQIQDSRKRLSDIRDEQQRLREQMRSLSARVHDVTDELENYNRQIKNQEALLREMDRQLDIRDQQVQKSTSDLLRTRDQLVEKRVLFSRRARDLYKKGPLASVQILLAADNFSDLINRYHYLYLVALQDRLMVRQIEDLEGQLEKHREDLQREVRSLRDLRTDKVSELQDLYQLEQERARRLSMYRGQQSRAQQRLQQLSRDEKELNNLIGRLEREREAAEAYAASPTRGTLTPRDAGTLDWPVDGRVIYGFGQQKNSDGTVILRHGIGIAAKVGTPVRAVQTGTVVFAEPYLGFGPSVIVSHGGGYYSLYLHLSDVMVATGTKVTRGQVIGKVGGAGTHEGPHLEFQVWENRKAVDPLDWLRKRR